MQTSTYTIKTFNPYLGIIILASIVITFVVYLPHSYLPLGILAMFGVFAMFDFYGSKIEVGITETGVTTRWQRLPFFFKTYKEVDWNDIIAWKFSEGGSIPSAAVTFSIKTKEKQRLYIRCFSFFKREKNLEAFVQAFKSTYQTHNTSNSNNKMNQSTRTKT